MLIRSVVEAEREERPLRVPRRSTYTDVFGYIDEYGDTPVGEDAPLNVLDALVLTRVAYLYFDKLVGRDFKHPVALKDISESLLSGIADGSIPTMEKKDAPLARSICSHPRFSGISLAGYRSDFSAENVKQFAAVTILIGDDLAFVSYRGTDGSLNGWREDFDLGFLGVIPSDVEAVSYAEDAMRAYPKRRFLIGGHSKGGNLAEYAAFQLSKNLKRRLDRVYIFDAPGFRRDAYLTLDRDSLEGKVEAYAPSQSIFGMILYTPAVYRPILSRSTNVFQHDIYNWCVDGKDLVPTQFSPLAYGVKKMSKDFFETMDIRYLESCIDVLFSAFREAGLYDEREGTPEEREEERRNSGGRRIFSLMMMLRKIPREQRKTFMSIFTSVASNIRRMAEAERHRRQIAVEK